MRKVNIFPRDQTKISLIVRSQNIFTSIIVYCAAIYISQNLFDIFRDEIQLNASYMKPKRQYSHKILKFLFIRFKLI